MNGFLHAARVSVVALLGTLLAASPWVRAADDSSNPAPEDAVRQALLSELGGPSPVRETLLRRALEQDPGYAPARWALGYVRYDEQWRTLDEVAQLAAGDERLAEYRKRRAAIADRAEEHRELARWCQKNRLDDERRIHWARVLEFDPQDAEALEALGLQIYEGRLLTQRQIAEAKQEARDQRQAMNHWQPKMAKWRKAIERSGSRARTEALEALATLSDPEAIPALEATFAEDGEGATADAHNLLLIETVGRMPHPEATQVLLRRAMVPESTRVREAACAELKKRPAYAYVPQLIAATPQRSSTEGHWYVHLLPLGGVGLRAELHQQNGRDRHSILLESQATVVRAGTRRDGTRFFRTENGLSYAYNRSALASLQRVSADAERRDQVAHFAIERARFVLAQTVGWGDGQDASDWWEQWYRYSEQYSSPYDRPTRRETSATIKRYCAEFIPREHSCFPAGTLIQTLDGPRPIETTKAGDRVLSQDLATGELTYKPVQRVTLRPAAPLVVVRTGDASVSATRGHPFWVAGQGWTLAKHVRPGDVLSSVDHTVVVDAIEEAPAKEAYNLVVAENGTYFAGAGQLLVHDNTPIAETAVRVPGLPADVATP